MQQLIKRTRIIILCIIITFLAMSVLCTLLEFIQTIILIEILFQLIIVTFWLNPFFAIAIYFFIKRLVKKYSKQEYTDMEWTLIKLGIILAQIAGVTMAYLLALSIDKAFFLGMFGGIGIFSVNVGMGATLVIMLLGINIKELYPAIKMLVKNKKEKMVMTKNEEITVILLILIVLMCILILIGFLSGKELERIPSVEETVQKKAEYIKKNEDYIETIRKYVEGLNYEKIVLSGEWKQKVGNLNVRYAEKKGYSVLHLDAEEVLNDIGLKDINIIATYGDIEVEFDTKSFEIKKIIMIIKYKWEGQRGLIPVGLAWYSPDNTNRSFGWAIIDDNWQIE